METELTHELGYERGDLSAQACLGAEQMLDQVAPAAGERSWMTVFTAEHMLGEQLYMAEELHCVRAVQRIAPAALACSPGGARRQVLYTTALAGSYLPAQGNPHSDVDQVCDLLSQLLPSLGSLHSARSLGRVNALRRALATYPSRPSVQEFEDRFRATVMVA